MRTKKTKKLPLIVSLEAIDDFRRLNSAYRLKWLDEMRTFLSKILPATVKKQYLLNQSVNFTQLRNRQGEKK